MILLDLSPTVRNALSLRPALDTLPPPLFLFLWHSSARSPILTIFTQLSMEWDTLAMRAWKRRGVGAWVRVCGFAEMVMVLVMG